LESLVAEKGLDIPVYVDSFIVFSAPKGQYIRIDDRYRREKHCFRTGLNKKIENYLGCAYYKADQLEQLGEIISEMETNVKRFETKLNYDEVRSSLAEALEVMQDAQTPNVIEFKARAQQENTRKSPHFKFSVASALANFLMTGATALLNIAGETA
jgi:UV DNA damage repair endonuclease